MKELKIKIGTMEQQEIYDLLLSKGFDEEKEVSCFQDPGDPDHETYLQPENEEETVALNLWIHKYSEPPKVEDSGTKIQ